MVAAPIAPHYSQSRPGDETGMTERQQNDCDRHLQMLAVHGLGVGTAARGIVRHGGRRLECRTDGGSDTLGAVLGGTGAGS